MPKLVCPCGFVHDLSPIPDTGWITVRDTDYEELIEGERGRPGEPDLSIDVFVRLTGKIYDCPECHRVMWMKPGEKRFTAYLTEEPSG